MKRLVVVSPRPPRFDGQGDQRRALEIVKALEQEWEVEVVSWLPDVDHPGWRRYRTTPGQLARIGALAFVLPAQVAYVQSLAPRSLHRAVHSADGVVFVTDRAAPRRVPSASIVDFVDDLSASALRKADAGAGLRKLFWRAESRRVRRLDRRLARTAKLSVAVSPADAASIGPSVQVVPLSVGTTPLADTGSKVVFTGNLFYAPNHEAAMWMCAELAPALARRGIPPDRMVIAGRRPHPTLHEAARGAGIELRADVPDLVEVLREAAVALAPMKLGAGLQYKILDAAGAGRACVISPVANVGIGLEDGRSALVRAREGEAFAEAIVALLADRDERARLATNALDRLAPYLPDQVAAAWRELVRQMLEP